MAKPSAKPVPRPHVPKPAKAGLTAQAVADVLSLLACAACTDAKSRRPALLAIAGGVTAPLLLLALPSLFLGYAGMLTLVIATTHAAAVVVRMLALNDASRHIDRAESPHAAAAAAFLFWPEAVCRSIARRGEATEAVEVWRGVEGRGGACSLSVCGVPPLAMLRSLAFGAHSEPVIIVNLCGWWAGYTEVYASLGLQQIRFPAGSADVLEVVATLRKICLEGGGGGGESSSGASVRVVLHCETGALACAVAAAFVSALDRPTEPSAAAEHVSRTVAGRLPCGVGECTRLAGLVRELSHGKGGGKKGRAAAATATATDKPSSAAPPPANGDDEDDDDSDDEAAAEAERAERWANYQRAVAQHGLPSAGAATKPADGGGWSEVSYAPTVRQRPAASYASTAREAEARAVQAQREADGLSEKQRKNRRKAEKAKEESARREAEQKERLQATIRERARG